MISFERGGLTLSGYDSGGTGLPIIFQHGLGGDNTQVAESFPEGPWRRLTLECRGHHNSLLGDPRELLLATFSDDVLAFATQQGVNTFVAGGISMGAAIALRLAITAPERVRALALVRPAWLWEKAPETLHSLIEVSEYLSQPDLAKARQHFEASATARDLSSTAPDNLASLRQHFDVAKPLERADLLAAIASDGPGVTRADLASLHLPVLIVGTPFDLMHPLSYAQTLRDVLPEAQLLIITAKTMSKARYHAELKQGLHDFFQQALIQEGLIQEGLSTGTS